MAKRRKEILQQAEEAIKTELSKPEVIEIAKDAFDELLAEGLAAIQDMKEPEKSSAADNLKRYYDAMRKSRE